MAPRSTRRSRALESDEEDSRPNTPSSSAPNDSKRQRRFETLSKSSDDEDDASPSGTSIPATQPVSTLRKPQANNTRMNGITPSSSGHQPGAIVRVKLINFVTYASAEFFPGPNLNMVIGPNGTGKSTLVCAICLGLGWPPSFLGRAKDAVEFIKHGCREATIEIELQRSASTRKNPVIVRVIKREGSKSVYTLNGGPSTGRAVQALANSFNIQIDNLCQFLPQDKVVEFAQMSPIELLVSTQRAVAGADMAKMHEDLKKLRSAQSEALNMNKAEQERLANLENRQEMQRTEVERMRERALVQRRLDWLQESRPLAQYIESRAKWQDAKEQSKALTQELKRLRNLSAPAMAEFDAKETYEAEVRAFREKCKKNWELADRRCGPAAKQIEEAQEACKVCQNNIEAEKSSNSKNPGEMKRFEAKIVTLERQKEQQPEEPDNRGMSDAIMTLKNQERAFVEEKSGLDTRKKALAEQGHQRNNRIKECEAELAAMETEAGKQETKLNHISRDTFRAWEWIKENRDEFSQHVYGPPLVECSLKTPAMADVIETLLQESDFKVITAQNREDFAKLQQKLTKEQGLHDISIRVCSAENLDQFRPPISSEAMQRLGLHSWALDHLEGPATVLATLCNERSLHRCGISPRELSQQQHDEIAKSAVSSYAGGRKIYQFTRRAEYGSAGVSARAREARPANKWTDQPVDTGRKTALQREISELKGEAKMIHTEFQSVKNEIHELEARIQQSTDEQTRMRMERDSKQQAWMTWRSLDATIEQQQEKINKLQEKMDGHRGRLEELNAEMAKALADKTEAVVAFASIVREVKVKLAALLEAEVMHVEASSDLQVLTAQNQHIVQNIQQKEKEVDEVDKIVAIEKKRATGLKETCRNIQAEAERLKEEQNEPGLADIFERIASDLNSVEKLEGEIDAEKAKLELTEGGSAGIIKEYEDRAKVVQKLRAKLQEDAQKQDDFKHSIREIRSKWEPRLEGYISRINDAFSDSFARIGCAGQVAVYKASSEIPADCTEENGGVDNGLDFTNWAIHISVKFRETEPLSLLDSHRQSGGERAVSTIFYLMALQSLSRAPFRVVDEINQGMDPRNERMVHGRMVDIAADDGGSQYFLITPKLLSGLKYRRGMTVLCIVSGENMPAAREQDEEGWWVDGRKVDFRAFVRLAKDLGYAQGNSGRRVDSGVGMRGFGGASQVSAVGA
ncbi:hypothetical protein PV11_09090 [Exophiala sideris]|uniref:Structural maintenance of chromosomes protein 5 n=1 Tax=Exophiala sideris TaxID=1016849 RepID=A0A0D1Y8Z0_9EURO|nr:hypothetical protein PV11_09090 [Exophiala sideris]